MSGFSNSSDTTTTITPGATTWTCFGCEREQRDSDDMPQFCPKCGGVWVRPIARRVWWQRIIDRIDRAF